MPDEPTTGPRAASQFVSEVRTHLESFWRATAQNREERREDFDFVVGNQWKTSDKQKLAGESRPILTFNLCQALVNFLAGYQAERETDPRAFPRGSEDEQLGRILTNLMKYAKDVAGGERELHQYFRKGIIGGESVMEVGHAFDYCDDLVEGEATLIVLPENSWACDPGARRYDRNDATWQCKLMWMPVSAAKRKWDEKQFSYSFSGIWDGSGADPRTTGVPDHLLAEFMTKETRQIRVMQYWYQVPVKATFLINTARGGADGIFRMPSEAAAEAELRRLRDEAGLAVGNRFRIQHLDAMHALENVETGEQFPTATADEAEQRLAFIKQQAGTAAVHAYRIIKRDLTAVRVSHLTAWDQLDDGPSPDQDDWRYRFVPFVPYQDLDDYNSKKGIIRDVKDPQREVNWQHSTQLDIVIRGPKGQTWLPKADHHDLAAYRQTGHLPGFVGEFTTQPPTYVAPPPVSPGVSEMMATAMQFMLMIPNINAEMLGQTTQKTVSGRAIQSRQAGGLVGVASALINWVASLRMVYTLEVKRIQQRYSVEKMARIIGEQQRYAHAAGMIGPAVPPDAQLYELLKRLKEIEFDVKIDFQEASATARQAQFTQMMQLVATGFPVPPELVLETSDVLYKNEIKAALDKQGMQPPNEAIAKILGAAQGSGGANPDGVNASR